jgi:hypothetical protein
MTQAEILDVRRIAVNMWGGVNPMPETSALLVRLADEIERLEARVLRTITIAGACPCGIACVRAAELESLDSGTTLRCEAGHDIIIDVSSPEARAAQCLERERLTARVRELEDAIVARLTAL